MKINVDVNAKNSLIKVYVIKDMFGIQVIASVIVINLGIDEHLDYSNCKCRKQLVDPLVEECTENINETKLIKVTVENENKDSCRSYVVYKVLFVIFFMINIVIIIYYVYHVYVNRIKYNLHY